MTRLNEDYPPEQHQAWKLAATHKGLTLKEWARRALNKVAAEEEAERAEAERQRRSRPT